MSNKIAVEPAPPPPVKPQLSNWTDDTSPETPQPEAEDTKTDLPSTNQEKETPISEEKEVNDSTISPVQTEESETPPAEPTQLSSNEAAPAVTEPVEQEAPQVNNTEEVNNIITGTEENEKEDIEGPALLSSSSEVTTEHVASEPSKETEQQNVLSTEEAQTSPISPSGEEGEKEKEGEGEASTEKEVSSTPTTEEIENKSQEQVEAAHVENTETVSSEKPLASSVEKEIKQDDNNTDKKNENNGITNSENPTPTPVPVDETTPLNQLMSSSPTPLDNVGTAKTTTQNESSVKLPGEVPSPEASSSSEYEWDSDEEIEEFMPDLALEDQELQQKLENEINQYEAEAEEELKTIQVRQQVATEEFAARHELLEQKLQEEEKEREVARQSKMEELKLELVRLQIIFFVFFINYSYILYVYIYIYALDIIFSIICCYFILNIYQEIYRKRVAEADLIEKTRLDEIKSQNKLQAEERVNSLFLSLSLKN